MSVHACSPFPVGNPNSLRRKSFGPSMPGALKLRDLPDELHNDRLTGRVGLARHHPIA